MESNKQRLSMFYRKKVPAFYTVIRNKDSTIQEEIKVSPPSQKVFRIIPEFRIPRQTLWKVRKRANKDQESIQ